MTPPAGNHPADTAASLNKDPRIYFAAERTLLAWLRTGIAVIGIGFLVARFGLFLSVIHPQAHPARLGGSSVIGTGFVLLGAAVMAVAAWQHRRFMRSLGPADMPPHYWPQFSIAVAVCLALLGGCLALYLIFVR